MKKALISLMFFGIILGSFSSAQVVDIEVINMDSTIIAELDNPTKYTLKIKNNGLGDNFEIFSLVGVSMSPRGTFIIESGQTKEIEVMAWPSEEIRKKQRGIFLFEYQVSSKINGNTKDSLRMKIIELEDVFSTSTGTFSPGDKNVEIEITNKQKINLEDVNFLLESEFFEFEQQLSFSSEESKSISIPINQKSFFGANAGEYAFDVLINYQGAKAELKGNLDYMPKESVFSESFGEGAIIRKETIIRTNQGNIETPVFIEDSRDILSRLFTIYTPSPDRTERSGLFVNYFWEGNLTPGESLEIVSRTNYTFPFIALVVLVLITLGVRTYLQTNLTIMKNVSFVKTKGGEFALKTTIRIKATTSIEKIKIIEKIPRIMKLYNKFGIEPDKIDHKTRTLEWDISNLNPGEEKVFSYIMYSKMNLVGKVSLPQTSGVYHKNGKIIRILSNQAFIAAETAKAEENRRI